MVHFKRIVLVYLENLQWIVIQPSRLPLQVVTATRQSPTFEHQIDEVYHPTHPAYAGKYIDPPGIDHNALSSNPTQNPSSTCHGRWSLYEPNPTVPASSAALHHFQDYHHTTAANHIVHQSDKPIKVESHHQVPLRLLLLPPHCRQADKITFA